MKKELAQHFAARLLDAQTHLLPYSFLASLLDQAEAQNRSPCRRPCSIFLLFCLSTRAYSSSHQQPIFPSPPPLPTTCQRPSLRPKASFASLYFISLISLPSMLVQAATHTPPSSPSFQPQLLHST